MLYDFVPELPIEPDYDDAQPVCPVCGRECETIFYDSHWGIAGCDECVTFKTFDSCDGCEKDSCDGCEKCVCPVCGEQCETLMYYPDNECCGCDKCTHERNSTDEERCYE